MRKKGNQNKKRIRVMLVDDHAAMRQALRTIINAEPDLTVVAEADCGRAALDLVGRAKPDVSLMDGSMPEMNGMETTRQLKRLQPGIRIVALTLYDEAIYLEEMISAGAVGYVLKAGEPARVLEAIRAVAAGRTYFDKDIPRDSSEGVQDRSLIEKLSADELEVMKRLANGQTNGEIAADLELALPAVEKHRFAAMEKLNVRKRTEIARVAARHRWLVT